MWCILCGIDKLVETESIGPSQKSHGRASAGNDGLIGGDSLQGSPGGESEVEKSKVRATMQKSKLKRGGAACDVRLRQLNQSVIATTVR